MPSPLESKIRDHLRSYLDQRSSLSDFEEWFAGVIWNIESRNDPEAEDLAYEIDLRLAEYSRGHLTLDELDKRFRGLAVAVVPTPFGRAAARVRS